MNANLCTLSCYESPRRFGDAAAGGLVINGVYTVSFSPKPQKINKYWFLFLQFKGEPF